MMYEVKGVQGRYIVSGRALLEALDSMEEGDSLVAAIERKLPVRAMRPILYGSDRRRVPKESLPEEGRASCTATRDEQWIPCRRCWTRIMRQVFQNRGRYCVVCGATENIQGHHIIPRSECGVTPVTPPFPRDRHTYWFRTNFLIVSP